MGGPDRLLERSGEHAPRELLEAFRAGRDELPSDARWEAIEAGLRSAIGPGWDAGGPSEGGPSDGGPSEGGPSEGGALTDGGPVGELGTAVGGGLEGAGFAGKSAAMASGALGAAKTSSLWGPVVAALVGGSAALATGYATLPDDPARPSAEATAVSPRSTVVEPPPRALDRPEINLPETERELDASEAVPEEPKPSAPVAAPAAPSITDEPPASEADRLLHARSLVTSNPARALELLREHAELYPQGMLAQERELLMIDALVALGQRTEAVRRARAFLAAFPGSAHQRRLEVLLPELLGP